MPKIALVGEAWGAEEDVLKHPFVGPSGRELIRMCHEAGIFKGRAPWFNTPQEVRDWWLHQDRVSLHNVFNLRPANNDIETLCTSKSGDTSGLPPIRAGKYVRSEYLPELSRLATELKESGPSLIVALGNVPSWALLGTGGISKIRGAITTERLTGRGYKVLPTYHPAAILREWSNRPTVIFDLAKAERESADPALHRPERSIHIAETIDDLHQFDQDFLRDASIIAADIETRGNQITCIGFAPGQDLALVVPFVDLRRDGGSYWSDLGMELQAWDFVRNILARPTPKLFQNGLFDVQFLWRFYRIPTVNFEHDTMLLHHALQPESQKGLGFLGSIYTNEASWKLLNRPGTLKRDE